VPRQPTLDSAPAIELQKHSSAPTPRDSLGIHTALPRRARIAVISAVTACAVFLIGALLESWFIALLHPSEGELTWIGDLVLAITLGVVLYLWLHLRATKAALVQLERDRIVVDTQLAMAAKIQRDLLPPVPAPRHGVSWAVQLVPAGRIGGDYYDFVELNDRSQVAIVGDIAGKGIPAAMMLIYVRAVFRQAVRETREPFQIVARLANAVYAETRGESYLTCLVVRIDEERRELTSTTAGHPPAIVTGTSFTRLTRGGPPAGLFATATYDQETVFLVPGDRVVFVTDGITERITGGIEHALVGVDGHRSAEEVCEAVFGLSEGPGAVTPVPDWDDDRTALVLAVDDASAPAVNWTRFKVSDAIH